MNFFKNTIDNLNKPFVYAVLLISVFGIVYITLNYGYVFGFAFALIPFVLLLFSLFVYNPYWSFFLIFFANYYLTGLSRYFTAIAPGIYMDIILVIAILSIILQFFKEGNSYKFSSAFHGLTLLSFIWMIYCIFQLLNPGASPVGWATTVRGIGIYFFIVVVITSIVMRKYKDIQTIFVIWAIFALTAVLKAFYQKTFGFDAAEKFWLYVEGASSTHIIYSGIRYFSFFTDAANFGTGIAFSGIIFAIVAVYVKKIGLKIFFFITFLACMYGVLLSGTRGSIAVPFVGFTLYAILSQNIRNMVITGMVVLTVFMFLKFTNYGQGNTYIRRMRSAFNTDDASFQVRVVNQARLRTYMFDKPFGVGIGMSNGAAQNYTPDPVLAKIPSDSWYVFIWLETGLVGLVFHVFTLLFVMLYGGFLVLFRLKSRELKGFITAIVCGLAGLYVSSYSIEILGQFPTNFLMYISMTFIYLSPGYDRQLAQKEEPVL